MKVHVSFILDSSLVFLVPIYIPCTLLPLLKHSIILSLIIYYVSLS